MVDNGKEKELGSVTSSIEKSSPRPRDPSKAQSLSEINSSDEEEQTDGFYTGKN